MWGQMLPRGLDQPPCLLCLKWHRLMVSIVTRTAMTVCHVMWAALSLCVPSSDWSSPECQCLCHWNHHSCQVDSTSLQTQEWGHPFLCCTLWPQCRQQLWDGDHCTLLPPHRADYIHRVQYPGSSEASYCRDRTIQQPSDSHDNWP